MERSLISFWSIRDLVVLFTTMACGAALWLSGRAARPRLTVLPIFGLAELVLNALLFAVALQPVPNRGYWLIYWYGATAENMLICLLAAEITCAVLPRRQFVLVWCAAGASLAMLTLISTFPARLEPALLRASLAGDFISASVLAGLLYFPEIRLPRSYRLFIAGIIIPAGIHSVSTFQWLSSALGKFTQAVLPLNTLLALLLFLTGTWQAKQELQNTKGTDCSAPLEQPSFETLRHQISSLGRHTRI